MNPINRILFPILFVCLISLPGFSQETNSTAQKDKSKVAEPAEAAGLRKIASGSQLRNLDIDINIDEEALEASIESAVEVAMESVEVALERLEIRIEPIEIDLSHLNMDIEPIVIHIPDVDINIEPIEFEFDLDDADIDEDQIDWDTNEDDKYKKKGEASVKDKTGIHDKDKSKGLKKIN